MSEKNTPAHDSGSEALTEAPEAPAVPEVAGYDVATGTWNSDAGYDLDTDQDFAETEQL